ncbi:MAG: patatin-like phospholipase family protein [Nanoarchaeota archaeon]|jgi:NTE family protein|nr:patatin-like phospholipase family protein [Nanoarchaeota archaeon]
MLKRVTVERLKREGFSLVLSGGAALGVSHIGVLEWINKNNLIPDEIVGTSIGAFVGALRAIGKSPENILEIFEELEGVDLFKMKYIHGHLEFQKVSDLLIKIFKKKKMKDVLVDLKIVATSVKTGEAKLFTGEDNALIADVVRASISIPGVLRFKKIKGEEYMDGGIASNLPVEFANPRNVKIASNAVNHSMIIKYKKHDGFFSSFKDRFSAIEGAMHYLLRNQTYSKTPYIKKLVLIEPNLHKFKIYNLENYHEMLDVGYETAKKKIYSFKKFKE